MRPIFELLGLIAALALVVTLVGISIMTVVKIWEIAAHVEELAKRPTISLSPAPPLTQNNSNCIYLETGKPCQ